MLVANAETVVDAYQRIQLPASKPTRGSAEVGIANMEPFPKWMC